MLERILTTSFADLFRWVREYRVFIPRLTSPAVLEPLNAVLELFPETPQSEADQYRLEFLRGNPAFTEHISKIVEKRRRGVLWRPLDEFLYVIVRSQRPVVMIETGVFDGQSTTAILAALERNNHGKLLSIDLPATKAVLGSTDKMREDALPVGCSPGWAIPDSLRQRHIMLLGDSKELLPKVLADYKPVDIFFHDSLHTDAHMFFEYSTAWPYIRDGGLIMSDDIFFSAAFSRFAKQQSRGYVRVTGNCGAIRKKVSPHSFVAISRAS